MDEPPPSDAADANAPPAPRARAIETLREMDDPTADANPPPAPRARSRRRAPPASFSDLPDDVLDVLGSLLPPGDSRTVASCASVSKSWRSRLPEAWAANSSGGSGGGGASLPCANNDDDDEAAAALALAASSSDADDDHHQHHPDGNGGAASAADAFLRHPPMVDLDASAPDWEDRCSALRRLMPRGLSSARLRLPGRRAVAAGAPSAPRVLAALLFALRGTRSGSGGGGGGGGEGAGGGGLQHLTLHLDEDGVELFDEEEEAEGEEQQEERPPPALPDRSGGGNDTPSSTAAGGGPPPLPPHLGSLRSLAVTGGALSRRSTARLLRALAAACPRLEALRLLPDRSVAAPGAGGVADTDVPLLAALAAAAPLLETLEFSAAATTGGGGIGPEVNGGGGGGGGGGHGGSHGLGGFTGAGLVALARALPSLRVLRVHRLDALAAVAAADAECFSCRPSLRELHLGTDAALPPAAARRLAQAAGGLSMRFRWSEPPLLRTATIGLAGTLLRLDLGVVRLPEGDQKGAERFVASLAALTRLQGLRCALTAGPLLSLEQGAGGEEGGGEDDQRQRRRQQAGVVTLPLSQLASLTGLRALEITKRAAWSVPSPAAGAAAAGAGAAQAPPPPRGAFLEPSLAIPLSPANASRLAASCGRLRSLRLRLSRRDVSAEGLAALAQFSRLERLSLVVDYNNSSGGGGGSSGGGGGSVSGLLSSSPPALSSSPLSSSSFLHATSLVSLDLLDLPPTLIGLHLRHVSVSTPASALEALVAVRRRGGGRGGGKDDEEEQQDDDDDEQDEGQEEEEEARHHLHPQPPLSHLADVDLEQCRVRPAQLAALASAASPSLRSLRLAGVAGLTDDAVASLGAATGLRELSVEAPGNRLVTQRGLLALGAPLAGPLRRLTWRSDDLSRLGPCLSAYAAFTALRGLSLSCTTAAAERGARLRRANEAAGGGIGVAGGAPLSSSSSSSGGLAAPLAGCGSASEQSPVDALRSLLPLATLEFSGAAPLPPLQQHQQQQQRAARPRG
jgi:hypothetical protein